MGLQKLLLVLVFVVTAQESIAQGEKAKLQKLIDDVWAWRLEAVPEFASYVGEHRYDDKLMNYSIPAYNQWKIDVEGFINQLPNIDRDSLSDESKIDYDLLKQGLETFVTGHKFLMYGALNPINFLEGIILDSPYWVDEMELKTKANYETLMKRLEAFLVQVDQQVELMREAIRLGRTNNNASMYRVPGEIDKFIGVNHTASTFYKAFDEILENTTIPTSEKNNLRQSYQDYWKNDFKPKLESLKNFIENEYMPATRSGVGVDSWPNGKAYYEACLKWHLSIDMTPEEVHQTGLREVDRIQKEMKKIKDDLGYKHMDLQQFFNHTRNDKQHYFTDEQDLLDGYTEIIQKVIKPNLTQLFTDIPDIPVVVKRMPYDGPGGTYSSPSTVNGTGTFYANTRNPETKPKFEMTALCLHEADPGHHMQSTFQLVQEMQKFRRQTDYSKYFNIPFLFPFHTAYTEGWALYAEALGEEMQVFRNKYELLGRYSSEIFRACRLVVDTGLHYKGWSQQQAVDYIYKRNTMGLPEIKREVERYMTWPGQATAYKIGEIKMWELRHEAERRLGSKFDLKAFHSLILRLGSSPLDVLERVVDDWVDKQQPRSAASTNSLSIPLLTSGVLILLRA